VFQVHVIYCITKGIPRFDVKSIEFKETTKISITSKEEIFKVDYPAYGNYSSERKVSIIE
jgi:hypothetical protein